MTTDDALARIDASLAVLDRAHKMSISGPDVADDATTYGLAAVVLREARALIPEAPTDDEREAIVRLLSDLPDPNGRADAILSLRRPRHRAPVTREEIEAAAQAMFEDPATAGDGYTWVEMVCEDPERADIWRADARRVLEAAESAR